MIFYLIYFSQQIDGYTAGVDYPIYNTIPKGLAFTCADKGPGYYSDPETQCQVSTNTIYNNSRFLNLKL